MSVQLSSKDRLRTFILLPLYIVFFILLLITIIFVSFLPNGKYLATKLYNFFGLSGLKVAGINLKVSGVEKIETTKSYVVISNHPSTLDIFTHITALPVSIRFLTKTELFRIPLLSRVLKLLGLPRIDRKRAQINLPKINDSIQRVIDDKNSIMIFPEGTRSNQKTLLPFKKGAAHIAKQFNLPIVPVVTHNAHDLMVKGGVWLKSGKIDIEIHSSQQSGTQRASLNPTDQRDLQHKAYFRNFVLGYTFRGQQQTRVSFEFDYGSGDSDPSDNQSEPHFCTVEKNHPWDKGELSQKILGESKRFIDNNKKGITFDTGGLNLKPTGFIGPNLINEW